LKSPYIIAEIASAHEGKPELAVNLFYHALRARADAVKFQIFNRDSLLTINNPYYNEFGEIELSAKSWKNILKKVSSEKIDIIVEPYDMESFDIAEKTGFVDGYKIPTASIDDISLLSKVQRTNKSVYIGVGGAEWSEIENVVSYFNNSNLTLLCGFQNFPTKLKDSKLYQIKELIESFGCSVGYADHVDAEDHEMANKLPTMAVVAGASVIEKHITDDRSRGGRDYYSALNPDEFKKFVQVMRYIPEIVGKENDWSLSKAEIKYRRFTKRHAVAASNIISGETLDIKDIVFKRTNEEGLSAQEIIGYIGREFIKEKNIDDPIKKEDFIEK